MEIDRKQTNIEFLLFLKERNVMSVFELLIREIIQFRIPKEKMLDFMQKRFAELGSIEKQFMAAPENVQKIQAN